MFYSHMTSGQCLVMSLDVFFLLQLMYECMDDMETSSRRKENKSTFVAHVAVYHSDCRTGSNPI